MKFGIADLRAVRSGTGLSRLIMPVMLAVTVFLMPLMIMPILEFEAGSTAFAAGGNPGGNGGGGGGGNGGGDKNNKPKKGDLYGDVVYLLRDETGIPYVVNGCIRPLDASGHVLALNADDTNSSGGVEDDGEPPLPDEVEYNACPDDPQVLMSSAAGASKVQLSDVDEDDLEACDPIANCAPYVVEVELGRLSMLRSPPSVIDKALRDANDAIDRAAEVLLDWGGRIAPDANSLDAPLINLAMMREFMVNGAIDEFDPASFAALHSLGLYGKVAAAAFGLGAGDDKEGTGIDPEVVMRVIESLGIGEPYFLLADGAIYWGQPSENEEPIYIGWDIFNTTPGFDHRFSYTRSDTFPGNVLFDEYSQADDKYYRICSDVISEVFGGEVDPGELSGLEGFAQAANDARRVLLFVHDGLIHFVDSVYQTTDFATIEVETGMFCPL